MITRKTVLVLGAGASKPYEYPLGDGLRRKLGNATELASNPQFEYALQELRISHSDLANFADAFRRSDNNSIDAWLGQKRNERYREAGKLCIAAVICGCEKVGYFERGDETHDRWYTYLWNRMIVEHFEGFADVPLRILTFNYDRSLEAYLSRVVPPQYSASNEEAQEAIARIQIKHLYGDVGPVSLTDDSCRAYAAEPLGRQIIDAARRLIIIPEGREDADEFKVAREWFAWADDIVFLGFGFDETNVRRLGLRDVIEATLSAGRPPPQVCASGYKLTAAERGRYQQLVTGASDRMAIVDARCIDTLRAFQVLI